MVGKLTMVLAKREAETYQSHGLHQEALAIYQKLLTSSSNLQGGYQDAIQQRIQEIQAAIDDTPALENQRLSMDEILRIQKGWGAAATESDLLVCARALCGVGHYQHALEEIVGLLDNGCDPSKILGLLAECLTHLDEPDQLPENLELLTRRFFKQPKQAVAFKLRLTRVMIRQGKAEHARGMHRRLGKDSEVQAHAAAHLAAIADAIEKLEVPPGAAPGATPPESHGPFDMAGKSESLNRRLSAWLKKLWHFEKGSRPG